MNGLNLSERSILLLNVLIGLAIIPFLALSATDIFKLRLAGNALPDDAASGRSRSASLVGGAHPRSYYDQIVTRDVFNLAPVAAPALVENENLDVKLVGVSQVSGGNPWAIVQDDNGKQSLYQVGQEIPNAGKLVDVTQDRAIILHNGHRVAIQIPRQSLQAAPPLQTPVAPGFIRRMSPKTLRRPGQFNRGIRRLGANSYTLTRSTVDGNLKNMAPLFTQIRATPQLEGGVASGYRLTEIQPNSIFQQIGLQDGDLLKSVNGQGVGDPAKAMAMLQSLQSQSSITIDVVRNGAPTTLHYNIR